MKIQVFFCKVFVRIYFYFSTKKFENLEIISKILTYNNKKVLKYLQSKISSLIPEELSSKMGTKQNQYKILEIECKYQR